LGWKACSVQQSDGRTTIIIRRHEFCFHIAYPHANTTIQAHITALARGAKIKSIHNDDRLN
jgi:hypothetical protein